MPHSLVAQLPETLLRRQHTPQIVTLQPIDTHRGLKQEARGAYIKRAEIADHEKTSVCGESLMAARTHVKISIYLWLPK